MEKTISRSSASEPRFDDCLDFSVTELRSILGNTSQAQRVIEFGKAKVGQKQSELDRFNNDIRHQAESIDNYIESRLNRNGSIRDYFDGIVDRKFNEWKSTPQITTVESVDAAIEERPEIVTSLFCEYEVPSRTEIAALTQRIDHMDRRVADVSEVLESHPTWTNSTPLPTTVV